MALGKLNEAVGDLVKVVVDDHVAVCVEKRLVVGSFLVDGVSRVGLASVLAGGEEDGVVLDMRTERPGIGVVVPFLEEEDAGLGAGVRFEGVSM